MSGALYIVGTPIGNLGDITQRALETLKTVDFIAAEDTRVTINLLNHFGIRNKLVSYHEHNSRDSGEKIATRLESGESCALVTDAGMPAISDPGEALVRLCAERGIDVIAVPGVSALTAAVALSGLPSGRFTFEGFLTTTKRKRAEHLESLRTETRSMVFYEAPHKLVYTLRDLLAVLGDRRVSISRELTKLHEETLRTTLSGAVTHFESTAPRGEFVLVVEGASVATVDDGAVGEEALSLVGRYVAEGKTLRDAVKSASQETGYPRNALYAQAVKLYGG